MAATLSCSPTVNGAGTLISRTINTSLDLLPSSGSGLLSSSLEGLMLVRNRPISRVRWLVPFGVRLAHGLGYVKLRR